MQVRYVFQSESYGPIRLESWPYLVNNGTSSFTGSHVMYIDIERDALVDFMSNTKSAAHMIKEAGSAVTGMVNLLGNPVGPRNASGATSHPHFSNTDATGTATWEQIMQPSAPTRADWLMQSLCSAHLEERHQWGAGIGVEDNLFITNEARHATSHETCRDLTPLVLTHITKMSPRRSYTNSPCRSGLSSMWAATTPASPRT